MYYTNNGDRNIERGREEKEEREREEGNEFIKQLNKEKIILKDGVSS